MGCTSCGGRRSAANQADAQVQQQLKQQSEKALAKSLTATVVVTDEKKEGEPEVQGVGYLITTPKKIAPNV